MHFLSRLKNSLIYRITKLFSSVIRPKMISHPKNFQGIRKENIRISTSTFIDYPQYLFLEENVYIGHHNFIEASNSIFIGKGTQITSHITITSHSSHISIRLYGSSKPPQSDPIGYVKGSIKIGDFTFVGPHSVITPNAVIGKGCIVSAYSYVKGEFPDYSIIGGNPAKVIGDVRDIDNVFLEKHPELKEVYLK